MTVYRWLAHHEKELGAIPNQSPMEDSQIQRSREELLAELSSVRGLLEQERLRSEAYLSMIKLAEEKYNIPIEKKSGAKQLSK